MRFYRSLTAAAAIWGALALSGATSAPAQVLFTEDFSTGAGTTPPAGWTNNDIAAAGDAWAYNNPGGRTVSAPNITGQFAMFDSDFASDNSLAEDCALESPAFDASLAGDYFVSFNHRFQNGFGGGWSVEVFNGSSWVSVAGGTAAGIGAGSTTAPGSITDTANENLDITAATGGSAVAQVRFRWTGDFSWFWAIDNVQVSRVSGTVNIGDASILEGNAGSTTLSFPVTISPAPVADVTMDVAFADGSAQAGSDYDDSTTTFTFVADGSTTVRNLDVNLVGDLFPEDDETFTVTISNASAGTVIDGNAAGTILDDDYTINASFDFETDTPPLAPAGWDVSLANDFTSAAVGTGWTVDTAVNASSAFANLGTGNATQFAFVNDDRDGATGVTTNAVMISPVIDLSAPAFARTLEFDASFIAFGGTGLVYAANGGAFEILGGFTVTAATWARYAVDLTAVDPGLIGAGTQFAFGYNDNAEFAGAFAVDNIVVRSGSLPPGTSVIDVNDASVMEGNAGTTALAFTVSLTPGNTSGSDITVDYTIAGGSATGGVDYDDTTLTGTLTFPDSGAASQMVSVDVFGDTDVEGNETFSITLSGATGTAVLGDDVGVGTIQNDDAIAFPAFGWDSANDNLSSVDLSSGAVIATFPGPSTNFFTGGDFAGSDLTQFFATNNTAALDTHLDSINLSTGVVTAGPNNTGIPDPANEVIVGLTWHPVEAQFYATVFNLGDGSARMGTVNPGTGAFTPIGAYAAGSTVPQSICIDNSGNAFALAVGAAAPFPVSLQSINLTTGAMTLIGATGLNDASFFDADFDGVSGTLFYPHVPQAGTDSLLVTINTTTGAATTVGTLGDGTPSFLAFGVQTAPGAGVDNWSAY